jgi:hypothetical protein
MCEQTKLIQIIKDFDSRGVKSQKEKKLPNLSSFLERAVKSQYYISDDTFSQYGIWVNEVSNRVHEVIKKLGGNSENIEVVETLSDIKNSLNAFSDIQKVISDDNRDKIIKNAISQIEEYSLKTGKEIQLDKDANKLLSHLEKIRENDNIHEIINYDFETFLNVIIDLQKMIEQEPSNDLIIRNKVIQKYDLAKLLLTELDGDYAWVDGLSVYIATSSGLLEPSKHVPMFDGPYAMTQEEYNKIENAISEDYDLDDYDSNMVRMIQNDCKPDTDYYTWSSDVDIDDGFYEFDQMMDNCIDLWTQEGDPIPWENFSDEYCLEWCEKIDFMKSKNLSWYDPTR